MNAIRLAFVVIVCLGIGFIAGWKIRQPPVPVSVLPTTATGAQPPQSSLDTTKAPRSRMEEAHARRSARMGIMERFFKLRSSNGYGLQEIFMPFGGGKMNPQFAVLYDLTPGETLKIEGACQTAKQRIYELSSQHAQLDPSSSPEKLVITIPPFPEEGGRIYNDLLASFESILGAERFAMFDEISGDNLEQALDHFGLGSTVYEVTRGEIHDGQQTYEIKKKIDFPPSAGLPSGYSSTGNSRLNAEMSLNVFPVLRSYTLPTVASAK